MPGFADLPSQFIEMRKEYRADYDAGQDSRYRKKRRGLGGGADDHYRDATSFYKAIEISRDMERNEPTVKTLIQRSNHNVVRNGFIFEPQTGNDELDALLFKLHEEWSLDPKLCDEAGELAWVDYEQLLSKQEIIDGDSFLHIPPEVSQIQMFEAHQVRTPYGKEFGNRKIVHGVELGENRKRINYHVYPDGDRGYRTEKPKIIPAYNADGTPRVSQMVTPARVTQTRGVPHMHAVFDLVGMYGDINFAMLVKQQMGASLAWEQRQTEATATNNGPNLGSTTEAKVESGSGGKQIDVELQSVEPGAVIQSPFGTELYMHSPSIVSAESISHLNLVLEQITLSVGVPLLLFLLDPSKGNFSTGRLMLDQAKIGFIDRQDRIERRMHRPTTLRNIRRWIRERKDVRRLVKLLPDAKNVFRHKWHKPRWPYNQPLQDAQATTIRLNNYINDQYAELSETGRDADDVRDRQIAFNASVIEASIQKSLDIEQKFPGVKVPWEMIANRASANPKLIDDQQQKGQTNE